MIVNFGTLTLAGRVKFPKFGMVAALLGELLIIRVLAANPAWMGTRRDFAVTLGQCRPRHQPTSRVAGSACGTTSVMIANFGNLTPVARVEFPKLAIMNANDQQLPPGESHTPWMCSG